MNDVIRLLSSIKEDRLHFYVSGGLINIYFDHALVISSPTTKIIIAWLKGYKYRKDHK